MERGLELTRQTLEEMKSLNQTSMIRIQQVDKELDKINDRLDKNDEIHDRLFSRLRAVEAGLEQASSISSAEFDKQASKWFNKKVAERVCWGFGIIAAVLATIWLEGFLRH